MGYVPLAGMVNFAFESASQPLFSLLCFWALFATTRYKKPSKQISQYFQVICQAPAWLVANPYLSFWLPRPSSFCQSTFFYTAMPSTSTSSRFVCLQHGLLFLHFISLQRSDPRPIEMFPLTSMGFESGPMSLSLPGVFSCLSVSLSSPSARCLFPFPFHSMMQYARKPPLLCMAHLSW